MYRYNRCVCTNEVDDTAVKGQMNILMTMQVVCTYGMGIMLNLDAVQRWIIINVDSGNMHSEGEGWVGYVKMI